mmetsp:Transcript_34282/g.61857  ORF Transcript_34282/g.61857 Transcript_34282/m.61857 type:complete len:211 (+) Transcript_34282:288-920(+)
MPPIFSRNFCVTATRTVMTFAAGPVMRILTTELSIDTNSKLPPPVPTKNGLISFKTLSTFSLVKGKLFSSSSEISTTSAISGIRSIRRRLIPIVIVTVELAHVPHAPFSCNLTVKPSISNNSTLPPSEIRNGRISSRTVSTFSLVNSRNSSTGFKPGSEEEAAAGEIFVLDVSMLVVDSLVCPSLEENEGSNETARTENIYLVIIFCGLS